MRNIFEYGKENFVHEILYHKFAIPHEKTGFYLTFSFASFKMEFKPLSTRHATVSKQLSNANNIFKATTLTYSSFGEGIEKVQ